MTHKPNVGDIVHVRGKVINVSRGDESVHLIEFQEQCSKFQERVSRAWVRDSDIVHIELRPLAVGDYVGLAAGLRGTIKAIDGAVAWVCHGHECYVTLKLNELARCEP